MKNIEMSQIQPMLFFNAKNLNRYKTEVKEKSFGWPNLSLSIFFNYARLQAVVLWFRTEVTYNVINIKKFFLALLYSTLQALCMLNTLYITQFPIHSLLFLAYIIFNVCPIKASLSLYTFVHNIRTNIKRSLKAEQ